MIIHELRHGISKWYISVGIWIWLNMFSPKYNILADLYPVNSHDIYIYIYMIIYVYYIYIMYMYVSIPVVSYCIAIFQSRIPYSTNGIFRTEAWPKPHWSRPHHYCGYGLFSIMKITASNITNILILRFMIYKLLMVNYFLLFICQCYGLEFVIDCF